MPQKQEVPFIWLPGQGADAAALARLRINFRRPSTPMGEAWFMGQHRRMFDELMGDLDALPLDDIIKPLGEITSGTMAFGEMEEWREWFNYLLASLIPRANDEYIETLLECLISAFITQNPDSNMHEPYRGFREDALNTLGRAIMDASCWRDGKIIIGTILHRYESPNVQRWFWDEASGEFSASMFFCLKYLDAKQIEPWLRSALAIECPHWRAQVLVWFAGAHSLLSGEIAQISQLDDISWPRMRWGSSHCLTGRYTGRHDDPAPPPPFLPAENRQAAMAAVRASMNDEIYLDWLLSIAGYDYLEAEIDGLPGMFRALYLV